MRITSPTRAGAGGGTLNTPGRTVAIWDGESLVMIVAMTLPPSAGRVCLRIAVRLTVPFEKSPISSRVQSAVSPERQAYATRGASSRPSGLAPNSITCGFLSTTSAAIAFLWASGSNSPSIGCSRT